MNASHDQMRTATPPGRAVRVFISSTFRDMHAEREELVKRVFPQLRQSCEQRCVTWSEVDLRWGITQEELAGGRALAVCLDEVANCHPFFVGLLGERYGWVPRQLDGDLLEREPWLAEYPDRSITELEIIHGALSHAPGSVHAFFYLRHPSFLERLPDGMARADFEAESAEAKSRLDDLKRRIRAEGFAVREYREPAQAGDILLEDFSALLDQLFPQESLPGPFEQESTAHAVFAASRGRLYVGPQRYFEQLDEHIRTDRPPLVVVGPSGAGKSALLANWAQQYGGLPTEAHLTSSLMERWRRRIFRPAKNSSPSDDERPFLLTHFVGASAESADWTLMLRRLMTVMQQHFGVRCEIPDEPNALRVAFANYLQAAAERGRMALLIDGIDQLVPRERAEELGWLPATVPAGVRVILSTGGGRSLEVLRERGWPALEIQPFRPAERRQFISEYLWQYRKKLDAEAHGRLVAAAQSANPLFLKTTLEELRLFGHPAQLRARIEHLLEAENVEELFARILARLEDDYERGRPSLIRDTMRLLWAARQGLSESELADLCGTRHAPLPSAFWSPLYLAVKESLINRNGLLTYAHEGLRRAVEQRYLPGDVERYAAHRDLAAYFARRGLSPRQLAELPWQLAAMQAWPELAAVLADPAFLCAAWPTRQYEIKAYWSAIEAHSPLRLLEAYRPIRAAPDRHADAARAVCALLGDTGHVAEALALSAHLEGQARVAGEPAALRESLSRRAVLLKRQGDLAGAVALLEEEERLCRELRNEAALAANFGNRAVILRAQGRLAAALALHREEELLCRGAHDLAGLGASLGNQGVILQEQDDLAGALRLLQEQEQICRELGNLAGLQKSLGNQGLIRWREEKTREAQALLRDEEKICRQSRDLAALHICLGNQSLLLEALGDYDGAFALCEQKEKICRELGDGDGLARALMQQAYLFAGKLRQPDIALPFAVEAHALAVENGWANLAQECETFIREAQG